MVQEFEKVEDCMLILDKVIACHKKNKFARYWGACTSLDRQYEKCTMNEYFRKRSESIEKSRGFKKI